MANEQDIAGEEWRSIPGMDPRYFVSNLGRVSGPRSKILKASRKNPGYLGLTLCERNTGYKRTVMVHRLVALAFLGPPPFDNANVNHIDNNKLNNSAVNLEWVTLAKNVALSHLVPGRTRRGSRNPNSTLSESVVREILSRPEKETAYSIAKKMGLPSSTVWNVRSRRNWKHIV